jgi:hypothetical protein
MIAMLHIHFDDKIWHNICILLTLEIYSHFENLQPCQSLLTTTATVEKIEIMANFAIENCEDRHSRRRGNDSENCEGKFYFSTAHCQQRGENNEVRRFLHSS